MRAPLLFLLVATAYVAGTPVPEEPTEYHYPRFYKMAGGDGEMHDIDLEAEPDHELLDEVTRNPANNQYFLYTRRNSIISQTLVINNANSILNSNFNANNPTIIIAHGWLSNRNTEPNPTVRRDDIRCAVPYHTKRNITRYALPPTNLEVPAVGRGVGQFLRFLNQVTGARFDNMHLVGFSLGAHLVGNAGRELGGQVARVTGLDPAGPMWSINVNRLRPTDGRYVEAIHTDGGYTVGGLGIGSAIANVDFFPNGGISQPGCLTNMCNHNRAWELFAATVTYNHLVGQQQCSTNLQITWNTCRGSRLNMGNDDLRKTGSGMYRLDTGRLYPY
ncbi:pancreatic triacylglycerol lipase-like [Leguminivora glycinivorella]|uniref:pancreatic triacylglycerol lipase-like n=1 Tax=Leguminivora glycinivorella TaxID=1035111 RepID=UPI002010B45F|nr:pancreatic triacylglycerol lipase-like [Leguminivora glycinivorella]